MYIGNYYEWHGTQANAVKYYYAAGTRVAMRTGTGAATYLMGDHLGSTSVTADQNGNNPAWQLYKAWGETRAGSVPTNYQYTGQYNNTELGLYYYGARWYDTALGRFTQPDSIIPLASQGVQAWDRYAGMNNNPVRYTDPTGHDIASLPWQPILETAAAAEAFSAGGGPPVMLIVAGVIAFAIVAIIVYDVVSENNDRQNEQENDSNGATEAQSNESENSKSGNVIEEIYDNPNKLLGKTPADVTDLIDEAAKSGWQVEGLGQGTHKGEGLMLREVKNGKKTGRIISWHPGNSRWHGPSPYWKVSSQKTGTVRIGPQFPPYIPNIPKTGR